MSHSHKSKGWKGFIRGKMEPAQTTPCAVYPEEPCIQQDNCSTQPCARRTQQATPPSPAADATASEQANNKRPHHRRRNRNERRGGDQS